MSEKFDYQRFISDTAYRDGYNVARKSYAEMIRSNSNYYAAKEMRKPINLKSSLKAAREHPLGKYHVQAFHQRLEVPAQEHRLGDNFVVKFEDHDQDSGLVEFTARLGWLVTPLIRGLYQYDPADPYRSVPLLKAFTLDLTNTERFVEARRLVTRFAQSNGAPLGFVSDRYWRNGHPRLLVHGRDLQKWWGWYEGKTLTKKDIEERKQMLAEYKFMIRYARAKDLYPKGLTNTATIVYNPVTNLWQ